MALAWRDTPRNRERWQQLQNNTAFLQNEEARKGSLQCHYCDKGPLKIYSWNDFRGVNAPDKATADHVMARARGGSDAWDNLVVCCTPCNARKGSS
ncbi:hypothetical protein GPECTOR_7g931 [Gonium pectorale]|uniref:HNH endonuclease 5 domain-containing protein n=1 Tax=Gonium pectorale TaxID=33097 RepID=A0A150GUI2_GONPE|nr:hypothetical protein GPECTOR_7g931 [Gonium pectorale]|eukprot:KXZ53481.1 hypothetical protein GPECTOR_7g931 [Gonium pectorale]